MDIGIRSHDAFCNFDSDVFSVNAVFFKSSFHDIKDIAADKVQTRKVKGHRDNRFASIQFRSHFLTDNVNDVAIKLMDLARFFESANKDRRIQKTILRIHPTGQRFHTAESFRNRTDHRLVVNLDVTIIYSLVNVVYHVILQHKRLAQIFIVITEKVITRLFLNLACNLSLFAGIDHRFKIINLTDPDVHIHRNLGNDAFDIFADFTKLVLNIFHVSNDRKMVIRHATNQVIREYFF